VNTWAAVLPRECMYLYFVLVLYINLGSGQSSGHGEASEFLHSEVSVNHHFDGKPGIHARRPALFMEQPSPFRPSLSPNRLLVAWVTRVGKTKALRVIDDMIADSRRKCSGARDGVEGGTRSPLYFLSRSLRGPHLIITRHFVHCTPFIFAHHTPSITSCISAERGLRQ
jgi:hypothetical protein